MPRKKKTVATLPSTSKPEVVRQSFALTEEDLRILKLKARMDGTDENVVIRQLIRRLLVEVGPAPAPFEWVFTIEDIAAALGASRDDVRRWCLLDEIDTTLPSILTKWAHLDSYRHHQEITRERLLESLVPENPPPLLPAVVPVAPVVVAEPPCSKCGRPTPRTDETGVCRSCQKTSTPIVATVVTSGVVTGGAGGLVPEPPKLAEIAAEIAPTAPGQASGATVSLSPLGKVVQRPG